MQVINDTEVFEPKECFFCVTEDPENPGGSMICITDMEYWNADNFLNDCFGDQSLPNDLVEKMRLDGIWEAMEAIWTSEGAPEQVRAKMLSYGFVESLEMAASMME